MFHSFSPSRIFTLTCHNPFTSIIFLFTWFIRIIIFFSILNVVLYLRFLFHAWLEELNLVCFSDEAHLDFTLLSWSATEFTRQIKTKRFCHFKVIRVSLLLLQESLFFLSFRCFDVYFLTIYIIDLVRLWNIFIFNLIFILTSRRLFLNHFVHQAGQRILWPQLSLLNTKAFVWSLTLIWVEFDCLTILLELRLRLLICHAVNCTWILNLFLVFRNEVEINDGVSHAHVLDSWNITKIYGILFVIKRMASSCFSLDSFRLNRIFFSIKLHWSITSFGLVWLASTPSAAWFTLLSRILIFQVMLTHCICLLIFRQLLNALLLAFFTTDTSYRLLLGIFLSTFCKMVHLESDILLNFFQSLWVNKLRKWVQFLLIKQGQEIVAKSSHLAIPIGH